jgi:hypothetical protein
MASNEEISQLASKLTNVMCDGIRTATVAADSSMTPMERLHALVAIVV